LLCHRRDFADAADVDAVVVVIAAAAVIVVCVDVV